MPYIPELFINYMENKFTSIYGFDEILKNNDDLIALADHFSSEFNTNKFVSPSLGHIKFNIPLTVYEIKKLFQEKYNEKVENFTFNVFSHMLDPSNEFSWRTYIKNSKELLEVLELNSFDEISLHIDFDIYFSSAKIVLFGKIPEEKIEKSFLKFFKN